MISDIIKEVKLNLQKLPQWEQDYINRQINRSRSS